LLHFFKIHKFYEFQSSGHQKFSQQILTNFKNAFNPVFLRILKQQITNSRSMLFTTQRVPDYNFLEAKFTTLLQNDWKNINYLTI